MLTLAASRRLVSRAGLAGGGAPKMTHARPPLTHASWVNIKAGWYDVLVRA
jgi:hypothetical protein